MSDRSGCSCAAERNDRVDSGGMSRHLLAWVDGTVIADNDGGRTSPVERELPFVFHELDAVCKRERVVQRGAVQCG